jgi:hypothetical protein
MMMVEPNAHPLLRRKVSVYPLQWVFTFVRKIFGPVSSATHRLLFMFLSACSTNNLERPVGRYSSKDTAVNIQAMY